MSDVTLAIVPSLDDLLLCRRYRFFGGNRLPKFGNSCMTRLKEEFLSKNLPVRAMGRQNASTPK